MVYGRKTLSVYSLKVLHLPGEKLTIAVLSRMTASTKGCSNVVSTWTHGISSDFCPVHILPLTQSAGGLELFSCLKNSSRYPSLAWQAMYILENDQQSFLRLATWLLGWLDYCFSVVPSKGRLHRCMVSVVGLDRLLSHSSTNLSSSDCPFPLAVETASISQLGKISSVSNTRRSALSSKNGFPISSITLIMVLSSLAKAFWTDETCLWWQGS